jgi:hypothetical protein
MQMEEVYEELVYDLRFDDRAIFTAILGGSGFQASEIRSPDNGSTLLHRAISVRFETLAWLLSQHTLDVNAVDHFGDTPLWWAVHHGRYDAAFMLLDYGASLKEAQTLMEEGERHTRWPAESKKRLEAYHVREYVCWKRVLLLLGVLPFSRDVKRLIAQAVWRTRRRPEWYP